MLGYKVQVYVVTTFPSSVNMTIKAFIGSFPTGYRATVPGTWYMKLILGVLVLYLECSGVRSTCVAVIWGTNIISMLILQYERSYRIHSRTGHVQIQ